MILFAKRTETPNSRAFAMEQKIMNFIFGSIVFALWGYIIVCMVETLIK